MTTPIWRPGETWAVDFMQDMLAHGRRFRTLNVLDTITRECLAIEVDTSLPSRRVVQLLDQLVAWHGKPKQITLDNGPEFTGQLLDAWAYQHGIKLDSSIRASRYRTATWRASTGSSAMSASPCTGSAA